MATDHLATAFEPATADAWQPAPTLPVPARIRTSRRYAFGVCCEVDIGGLGRAQMDCLNLSAVGAFFRADVLPDEGTAVRCALPLPGGTTWLVPGVVIRVDLGDNGRAAGIAVAFRGVSAVDRQRLVAAFAR